MSKIFDAYRKKAGADPDLGIEVGRVGTIALYPSPAGHQKDDFNKLANSILNLRVGSRGTVFSTASSESGEGASFVSFSTAVLLATNYDQKVAWVDANFLSPQSKLNAFEGTTFASLLENPDRVDDVARGESPCLVPGGRNLSTMRGMFADDRYRRVLANLAERFDIVILDLPPVLRCSESALMAAGTDGLVLVIEQKFLKWEVIQHGVSTLEDKGVTVLGSVINRREFALPKFIYDRL